MFIQRCAFCTTSQNPYPSTSKDIVLAIEHGSSWDQGTFSYTSIIMIVHEKISLNLLRRSAIKPGCTRVKLNCCTLTDGISFSCYSYIPHIAPKPRAIECTSKQAQSDCIELNSIQKLSNKILELWNGTRNARVICTCPDIHAAKAKFTVHWQDKDKWYINTQKTIIKTTNIYFYSYTSFYF